VCVCVCGLACQCVLTMNKRVCMRNHEEYIHMYAHIIYARVSDCKTHIHENTHTDKPTCAYLGACVCVFACMCLCVRVCAYVGTRACVQIGVGMSTCVSVCVHTRISECAHAQTARRRVG